MTLDNSQLVGEIWLVPVCNPLSTNQRTHYFSTGRYNTYDGKDWNRIFWDYEKECEDLEAFAKSQFTLNQLISEIIILSVSKLALKNN
jgi:predicted deacylase